MALGGRENSMWRYKDVLPEMGDNPVSLGEGLTPLVPSRLLPGIDLLWKDETRNPTGSHKDRALSLAATHARATGARVMVVVSAGSTGISNAAYAARAGLAAIAVMSTGAPRERVYPLHALGSRLIAVDAPIDELIAAVTGLAGRDGIYAASTSQSANPVQAEAARTIAFELVDDLGRAPDAIVVPVGGGGTLAAIHRGFEQLRAAGRIDRLPRLYGVVPTRYDTLQQAHEGGISDAARFFALPAPVGGPTVLNKIAHDHAPDGVEALRALRDSKGGVLSFDDGEAIAAVREIGARDGLYFEPSTAILLPALRQLQQSRRIAPGELVVALGCGSGFRETSVLLDAAPLTVETATLADLAARLAR
jgi:threonine synthase